MTRRSPIRHTVTSHRRVGKVIQSYIRGSGVHRKRAPRRVSRVVKSGHRNSFGDAPTLIRILNSNGFEGYVVGGSVRDLFFNRASHDVDIATNATPTQAESLFTGYGYRIAPVGKEFGTVLVHKPGMVPVEVTTYRSEGQYSDSRHPDEVHFEKELQKDLERRDFTINAMAYDPVRDELVDPFNGRKDLKDHVLRAVGDPNERFSEDPLRMIRMARFAGELGFNIEPETYNSAIRNSSQIQKLPKERVRDELIKILEQVGPQASLNILIDTGLMSYFLPEVSALKNKLQPKEYHKHDVLTHTLKVVRNLPKTKPMLRLAGLLHDVGKEEMMPQAPYFPGHEKRSVAMLDTIARRLRLSKEDKDYLGFLISQHMLFRNTPTNEKVIRRYLNKHNNVEWLPDLFTLIREDSKGTGYHVSSTIRAVDNTERMFNKVINEKQPFARRDLVINGRDIMSLGVKPSPRIGRIQEVLLSEVIASPKLNNRDYLLRRVRELNVKQ